LVKTNLAESLDLRTRGQTIGFDPSMANTLRNRPYGRWVLGVASFEDEQEVAKAVAQQLFLTFPEKERTEANATLLADASLAVLRGQANY
jgi:hypothetical protein